MNFQSASRAQLEAAEAELAQQYQAHQSSGLSLDLTRGKPSTEQVELSSSLDGILAGNYISEEGVDLRNYGGLDGIPGMKRLFAETFSIDVSRILIGGNSSLTLMYQSALFALQFGLGGEGSAWNQESGEVKFICPVPGYDRHFSVCEHLGIKMIPVAMDENGPLMDEVESLIKADPMIKGIWCVPRFSNPTGCVYSDEVVDRIAALAGIAGNNFRVFWDNAYAVHILDDEAKELADVFVSAKKHGTEDSVLIFGSTSKVTFAGAGVAFMAASSSNLAAFKRHLGFSSIGPDKLNQQRHINLLKDATGFKAHMTQHAAILKPRFDIVEKYLIEGLAGSGIASWLKPQGGYFVSFDSEPGLAKQIVAMAADAGVKLTPAGATFPYGHDPKDANIRLAPSYPSLEEIEQAMAIFVVCVKLATVRKMLNA
ncbi:alanine-glyoxylate aminotransferase-like protein [Sinobacterium caligoides]|uniref:Alanine-glyoxylate aminotransferase-like protein n=1 Tax=Sinobacterium caligoides TaxID=933926 RepID=A0A3N2D4M4_9GAMM|nr:aminotransferase class I/II-fold pyridoxal phosphate-dependent enzyme [Sinobacterium caligoides]ROR94729.1 alanine-glyoxylate aminotransferase-like protein [Sinobacterium caligoides]